MDRLGKYLALCLVVALAVTSLIMVKQADAQTSPVLSTPQFTAVYADHSYDVPTTTTSSFDPYTGNTTTTTHQGYHVSNFTIDVSIINQQFPSTVDNTSTSVFYNIAVKGHFQEEWESTDQSFQVDVQSGAEYTVYSFPANYLSDAQIDIRVQAVLLINRYTYEHIYPMYDPIPVYSNWSSVQTINLANGPASVSTPSQTPTPTVTSSPTATFSPTPSSSASVNVQFVSLYGGEASYSTENVHTGTRAVKLIIPTSAGEGSCAIALYSYRAAFSSITSFSIETSYFNATPRFVIYLDTNWNGSPDVFLLSDYQVPSNGQWNATTGGLRWGWSEASSDLSGYGQSWQPLSYWKNKYPNASVLFLGVALQYDVVVTNSLNGVTYDGLGQPLYADELVVNGVTYSVASSASPTAAPTAAPSSTASVPLSPSPTTTASSFSSPTATAALSPLPSSSLQPSTSSPISSPQPSTSSQLELYEVISGLIGAIVVLAVVAVALLVKKRR